MLKSLWLLGPELPKRFHATFSTTSYVTLIKTSIYISAYVSSVDPGGIFCADVFLQELWKRFVSWSQLIQSCIIG